MLESPILTPTVVSIPGYQVIDCIEENGNYALYRAIRLEDRLVVVVKRLTGSPLQTPQHLRYEAEMSQQLRIAGIPLVLSLERQSLGNRLESDSTTSIMVMEDLVGKSLGQIFQARGDRFSIETMLRFMITSVEILGRLHEHGIIHRNLSPKHIFWDPATDQVHLMNVGMMPRLEFSNPPALRDSLPYLSPEQTERLKRTVDYRSDFYSLGIIFYELLTGNCPFVSPDPMEMIHHHLARQPMPPHEMNSQVPIGLSAIVLRLLAKTPEERYQSAYGLRYDLKHCLQDWQDNGSISMFALGRVDRASQLNLTRQMYGREASLQRLLHQLERSQTTLQTTFICGETGVGKSFLVQELQRQVAVSSGYFIVGKCDDLHPELPEKPLIQALRQLVQQVLTESDDRIVQWRDRLKATVGYLGYVLVEVIPELALILGSSPQVPKLDPIESQNRFNFVLQAFLRVFAQPGAPLVIVLEDLQWSDGALLKLLAGLLGDLKGSALYLVGTYRTKPGLPSGPIETDLQSQFGDFSPQLLVLEPLTLTETTRLIADVLGESLVAVTSLAEVVFQRSQGNPFFIHQLLTFLQSERLLVFEFELGQWRWDLQAIFDRGLTDDMVDLMVEKIRRLSPELQAVLQVAACIGNEFDLELVAHLSHRTQSAVAQQLNQAVRDGLILPTHGRQRSTELPFRFLHDKLQQAAYSMMRSSDRQKIHWQVGQIGLKSMLETCQEDLLFDVVHQLNSGRNRQLSREERWQLAHLNFGAAKKAKASAAYELAVQYCEIGIALLALGDGSDWVDAQDEVLWSEPALPETPVKPGSDVVDWVPDEGIKGDSLTFDLMKERAECQYLCGNLDRAQAEFIALAERSNSPFDRAELNTIQMVLCLTHGQQSEAVILGLQGLAFLGVELTHPVKAADATIALNRVKQLLQARGLVDHQSMDRLSELPPLQSPQQLAILRLLQYLAAASVTNDLPLYHVVIAQMVERSLEYGNSIHSAYAYVAYGTILSASLGDYALGYALGRAALREIALRCNSLVPHNPSLPTQLPSPSPSQPLVGVTQFSFWGLLAHWHEPLTTCHTNLQSAFRSCCETGEFLYALYVQVVMGDAALMAGIPLLEVAQQLQQFHQFAQHRQHQILQQDAEVKQRFVRALQGETLELFDLSASVVAAQSPMAGSGVAGSGSKSASIAELSEAQLVKRLQSATSATTLSRYYIYKLQLLYLDRSYDAAVTIAAASEALIDRHYGTAIVVEHYFYQALLISAQVLDQGKILTPELRSQFDRNLKYLDQWSIGCPANFQARQQLLQAEKAAFELRDSEAITLYDRAIQTAHQYQNHSISAIASERSAAYALRTGRERLAIHALNDACMAYQVWGAIRKTKQLRRQLANLQPAPIGSQPPIADWQSKRPTNNPMAHFMALSSEIPSNLDWMTILKVSHTLSSEIVFTSLMEKLMRIVIENAGAQRGLLVMRRNDRWHIEAFGRVEQDRIETHTYLDTATPEHLPFSLLSYVERTHQTVVLDHAAQDSQFGGDSYIRHYGTKSVLCFPILSQGKLSSILYLENNLAIGAFTDDRLEVLQLLTAQVVISMENARLYSDLQGYVQEVESKNQALKQSQQELETQTQQTEQAFDKLKDTQAQLVQTEKMSSLGQLVAGVAHEIKNPLNFISGNVDYAKSYVQQLMTVIEIYQNQVKELPPAIVQQIEQLDLPFIQNDLAKLLQSMALGTERIEHLIRSLQNFSRPSEAHPELANLHEGIETTLLILQPRLKATQFRPEISIQKHYSDIPAVECFPGEINQVFMNLIANAIDAIDERCEQFSFEQNQMTPDRITLRTEAQGDRVQIRVADSGIGLSEAVRSEVFKTFYTTKPVGKGTGLGLSISAQIVIDHHRGELTCYPLESDRGAEFLVELPIDLGIAGRNSD
jgi:predicted ATPase/signal transduction histidine kinase